MFDESGTTILPDIQACRTCGYVMSRSSAMDNVSRPKPGDVSICMKCGELSLFDDRLNLTAPTADELAALQRHTDTWQEVRRVQLAIKALRATGVKYPSEME